LNFVVTPLKVSKALADEDDPKHSVPSGLLAVLRGYGSLCEESRSYVRRQSYTAYGIRQMKAELCPQYDGRFRLSLM
jgi:hypothetical protein